MIFHWPASRSCLPMCIAVTSGVCPPDCLSICLFICLSLYLSACLSVCLFVSMSVCLSYWLSNCPILYVCLSLCDRPYNCLTAVYLHQSSQWEKADENHDCKGVTYSRAIDTSVLKYAKNVQGNVVIISYSVLIFPPKQSMNGLMAWRESISYLQLTSYPSTTMASPQPFWEWIINFNIPQGDPMFVVNCEIYHFNYQIPIFYWFQISNSKTIVMRSSLYRFTPFNVQLGPGVIW